jgi:hypothetical protein
VVFAADDDRASEPAGLLGMQTGRSLLVFKLAFVSVVLVGPKRLYATKRGERLRSRAVR